LIGFIGGIQDFIVHGRYRSLKNSIAHYSPDIFQTGNTLIIKLFTFTFTQLHFLFEFTFPNYSFYSKNKTIQNLLQMIIVLLVIDSGNRLIVLEKITMFKKLFLVFFVLAFIHSKSWAVDTLYYSVTDGSVRGIDIETGSEIAVFPSTAFNGAIVGAAREIAVDPVNRLLWYSATDDAIYSFHLDTLVEGPSIPSGRISGAAVGGDRHLYIDYSRHHLLVTTTSGDIQRFDLETQADLDPIPATFFTDGNVGTFRHLASDIRNGNIWYAATDGSFREFNPDSMTLTGREISFGQQFGADPGAYRHFFIDPNQDRLLYAVTDGSLASVPLDTLTRGEIVLGPEVFIGANPGAGRIITFDTIGVSGGSNGKASFTSNFLTLPFVSLGNGTNVSATLKFDTAEKFFSVEFYKITTQSALNTSTFKGDTGKLTIPAVDFQGTTYSAILNLIPGTLNFVLESVQPQ